MSTNRLDRTFRLAFIRRKIRIAFKSQAVRTALLTELNTRGPDSELIVRMVEKVPIPRQAVVQPVQPMPQPAQPVPAQPAQYSLLRCNQPQQLQMAILKKVL